MSTGAIFAGGPSRLAGWPAPACIPNTRARLLLYIHTSHTRAAMDVVPFFIPLSLFAPLALAPHLSPAPPIAGL
jgi:hypothetical protein